MCTHIRVILIVNKYALQGENIWKSNPNRTFFVLATFDNHNDILPLTNSDIFFQVDPELERKAQLERERNKQRQREKLFSITPPSEIVKAPISPVPAPSINKKYWKKEQNRIDAVLDPDSPQPEQFE